MTGGELYREQPPAGGKTEPGETWRERAGRIVLDPKD
jgi:hypothetical protein